MGMGMGMGHHPCSGHLEQGNIGNLDTAMRRRHYKHDTLGPGGEGGPWRFIECRIQVWGFGGGAHRPNAKQLSSGNWGSPSDQKCLW